jgi:predicted  nucleic acid-binding Zn-ribbon protein
MINPQEQIDACNQAFAADQAIALWEQVLVEHHAAEKRRIADLRQQAMEQQKEITALAKKRKHLTYQMMNLRRSIAAKKRKAVLNKRPIDRANRRILARKVVIRHRIEKQFMARQRDEFRRQMGVIPE